MISVPFLIFSGLPPQVAVATERLGMIGQSLGSIPKYWKANKINWRYVPMFTVLALTSAFIGANLLIKINADLLQTTIGILMLIILPLIFLKKEVAVKKETTTIKRYLAALLYFLLMIIVALGGSVGALITIIFIFLLNLTFVEANATKMVPYFFLSILTFILFAYNGLVDYQKGIIFMIGMFIGGSLGARFALKKSDRWIKIFFAIVVIISATKLLFFE